MRSVRKYYDKNALVEWNRLVANPYRKLELDTTLYYLRKYLPPKGLILDAGGGPGRYTIELLHRGYEVILLDISSACLVFAERQVKREGLPLDAVRFVRGSVENLSRFNDNSFDSVLCLGPLSHIVSAEKRGLVVRELMRVTKRRGIIFVTVISRLGSLVSHLVRLNPRIYLPYFKRLRDTGDYHGRYRFTTSHTFYPEELTEAFAREKQLQTLEIIGLEGISSGQQEKVMEYSKRKKLWKSWLDVHFATCTNPSVVGMSEHMMIVCRKV